MVKFAMIVLGILVLCSGLVSGNLGLEEGNSCEDSNSGKSGVCTRMTQCPAALTNWKKKRIRPTLCGYIVTMAVVCCEGESKVPTPRKRISQLKCEEYSKPVTETIYGAGLSVGADAIGTNFPNCTYDKVELVVGGDPALPGQFPHMAAIGWPVRNGFDFKCGGTLISERFVLTVGHCVAVASTDTEVTSRRPTLIRMGVLNLKLNQFDSAYPVDARIGRIVAHPDYASPSTYNDIALLEMQRPVEFNTLVRPACLWQIDNFGGLDSGIVTGWGTTAFRGQRSDVLQKVSLKLYSNDFCDPLLVDLWSRKWKGFRKEQICAGQLAGRHDSCQGDSGGPLQVTMADNPCIFYVMGIISFGSDCGVRDRPGIYTRVSSFIPWIESIVWPDGV